MKFKTVGLLDDVVSVYDQTKTTVAGRALERTVNSQQAIGPRLTKFIDVFTDTGLTPIGPVCVTPQGKMFVLTTITSGLGSILHYTFDLTTGAYVYVGRINYNLPNTAATTHTVRGFEADTTGGTWKIFIATTGSILINGGLFMLNGLSAADFVQVGFPTIALATGSNQKAVYFLQSSSLIGAGHTVTAAAGLSIDTATTKVYLHNGVAATHQFHSWDYSATPDVPGTTVTITIASPGVVSDTGHTYAANDQVVLSTTGALPTGLAAGTVYFVRNPVAGVSYELSATSGGASINTTGTQSGVHTARRAFGITSSLTYVATGNLPALTGTLLLTDSEQIRIPTSGSNSGNKCVFFATSTNCYQGRISELTAAATTWASLQTCNILGTGVDITAPTAIATQFDVNSQRLLIQSNTIKIIVKPFQNSTIDFVFGNLLNTFVENSGLETVNFASLALANLEMRDGWLFGGSTQTGQRGVFVLDFYSHNEFDYSYVVSPVVELTNSVLNSIATFEALFELTGTLNFYYRTSGFGSITGGWTSLNTAELLSIPVATSIQFKVGFEIATQDVATPAQLVDLLLGYTIDNENSDHWVGSHPNTISTSPARSAFKLIKAYATSVPKLYFRAYNDSGTLVASANTVDNASDFQYSTNNGTSWQSLGTIPNTVLTTEIRYNWAVDPGVAVTVSIREE